MLQRQVHVQPEPEASLIVTLTIPNHNLDVESVQKPMDTMLRLETATYNYRQYPYFVKRPMAQWGMPHSLACAIGKFLRLEQCLCSPVHGLYRRQTIGLGLKSS